MASDRSAYALAALFTGAGISHFARPDFFVAIVPEWLGPKSLANQVSGAAEIALGLAMIPRRTRPVAAWGLLGLLAAVYPANIDMAVNDVAVRPGPDDRMQRDVGGVTDARNWIRLPVQFVLAGWVWPHTRPTG